MTEIHEKEECVKCGESLDVVAKTEDRKPCPKCNSTARKRTVVANEKIVIKQSGEFIHSGIKTKVSYPLLIISFIVVFVGSFSVYYIFNSELSVIVGLVFGLVAWFVGKDAIDKRSFRNSSKF